MPKNFNIPRGALREQDPFAGSKGADTIGAVDDGRLGPLNRYIVETLAALPEVASDKAETASPQNFDESNTGDGLVEYSPPRELDADTQERIAAAKAEVDAAYQTQEHQGDK